MVLHPESLQEGGGIPGVHQECPREAGQLNLGGFPKEEEQCGSDREGAAGFGGPRFGRRPHFRHHLPSPGARSIGAVREDVGL